MSNVLRRLYERVFPASKRQVKDNINDVIMLIMEQEKQHDKKMKKMLEVFDVQKRELLNMQNSIINEVQKSGNEELVVLQKNFDRQEERFESLKRENVEFRNRLNRIENVTRVAERASNETVWGLVFEDTIRDSEWLTNSAFNPGRWAAGYQFLYVLYRTLAEAKPRNILELGLGQTTRMISQYAGANQGVIHRVTEHDPEWIEFFKMQFKLPKQTEIMQFELDKTSYLDDDEVIAYKNFADKVQDRKYDLITIDAPFGGMAKKYARIDVLQLLPQCLGDSFAIIIDDTNRQGELNTLELIKNRLTQENITYSVGKYSGNKDCHIITSEDKKFLCSM